MARLDVRQVSEEEINEIQFSAAAADAAIIEGQAGSDCLSIVDADQDSTNTIRMRDVDNMIKALEKAKELWGGKQYVK